MLLDRLKFGVSVIAVAAAALLPACKKPSSAERSGAQSRSAARELDVVLGVNNGLAKVFVRARVKGGEAPYCTFEARDRSPLNESKNVFKPFVPPERLVYRGVVDVDRDGDRWTEFRFDAPGGGEIVVCRPVERMGQATIDFFRSLKYTIDETKPPFAIVRLRTAEKPLLFPMRDLSMHADPKQALLDDIVPLETTVTGEAVVGALIEKLRSADAAAKVETLEHLARFPASDLDPYAAILLNMREQGTPEVRAAAEHLCRKKEILSDADFVERLKGLDSPDWTVVKSTLELIVRLGWKAKFRAQAPLAGMAQRSDLPEDVKALLGKAEAAARAPRPQPPLPK